MKKKKKYCLSDSLRRESTEVERRGMKQGSTHEKKPGGTLRLPTVEMKKVDF